MGHWGGPHHPVHLPMHAWTHAAHIYVHAHAESASLLGSLVLHGCGGAVVMQDLWLGFMLKRYGP
jgi:hypothetical protein